jgi:hypothetical protein
MPIPAPRPAPTLAELDAASLAACEVREAANAAALATAGQPIRFHPQAAAILDAVGKVTREKIDRYLDAVAAAKVAPAPVQPEPPKAGHLPPA